MKLNKAQLQRYASKILIVILLTIAAIRWGIIYFNPQSSLKAGDLIFNSSAVIPVQIFTSNREQITTAELLNARNFQVNQYKGRLISNYDPFTSGLYKSLNKELYWEKLKNDSATVRYMNLSSEQLFNPLLLFMPILLEPPSGTEIGIKTLEYNIAGKEAILNVVISHFDSTNELPFIINPCNALDFDLKSYSVEASSIQSLTVENGADTIHKILCLYTEIDLNCPANQAACNGLSLASSSPFLKLTDLPAKISFKLFKNMNPSLSATGDFKYTIVIQ